MTAALLAGCGKKGTGVLKLPAKGPGTCFIAAPDLGPEVKNLPVVPCEKEHTHELYAVVAYDKGDVFPGTGALDSFAERACVAAFEPYVGISVFESSLTFSWLVPTLNSWNNDKDRDVLCVVGPFNGSSLTGSVKDSRR